MVKNIIIVVLAFIVCIIIPLRYINTTAISPTNLNSITISQDTSKSSMQQNIMLKFNSVLENQIRFYDFAVKVFIGLFTALALLIAIGAFLLVRDRKSMRDEIVEESKYTINKLTREFEKQWQEIFDRFNQIKNELAQRVIDTKANFEKEIDKIREELNQKVTAVEQEQIWQVKERLGEVERELSSQIEARLAAPTTPTGIETNKEKSARMMLKKGNHYLDQLDLDNAIQMYTKAIELNPSYTIAYYNRGIAYSNKGVFEQAIMDYTKAIELDPKYASAYNNRGLLFSNIGNLQHAIEDHTKAIELNPNSALAYKNRGITYTRIGMLEEAITDFTTAIKINHTYARAMFHLARVYGIKNDKKNETFWLESAFKYKKKLSEDQISYISTRLKELESN